MKKKKLNKSKYLIIIMETERLKIKKKKKRIPVPQKPPKIIEGRKVYNRKKEKDLVRKKRI